MALNRLNFVNSRGLPVLESIRATLTTTGLTFTFNNHPYVNNYFQGLFIVKLTGTPTAPSTAVPVYFDTDGVSGSSVALNDTNATAITTGTFSGDGVYLCFYDRTTNVLRIINTN